MNILYIESDTSFSSGMLLGAMIDMGASVYYIENKLIEAGFDANIIHDTVKRQGMEAEYAYCKCENPPQNISFSHNIFIKKFCQDGKSNQEICDVAAACYAVESFSPDYIICSNISGDTETDKEFLSCISNEAGAVPDGYMMCVGYGAGDEDVLRVVLYSDGNDIDLAELELQSTL